MRREAVFVVQTYRRRDGQMIKAVTMKFTSASEAEDVAMALQGNFPAVLIYSATIMVVDESMDDVELFETYGDCSEILAA